MPGLINVDFADVRTIMTNAGSSLMGIGTGVGENRAATAARTAIASPLLEISIDGAKGVLFNITGGSDLTMMEVDEAAKLISSAVDPDANIIFGATIDENLVDQVKITVIATGFDETKRRLRELSGRSVYARPPVQHIPPSGAPQTVQPPSQPRPAVYNPPAVPSDELPPEEDEFDIPAFFVKRVRRSSARQARLFKTEELIRCMNTIESPQLYDQEKNIRIILGELRNFSVQQESIAMQFGIERANGANAADLGRLHRLWNSRGYSLTKRFILKLMV